MKEFLQVLLQHINRFLGNSQPDVSDKPDEKKDLLNTIQLALYKKAAVHVIYGNKSFTGDIVKWDDKRQQLILKNFKKSVTSIIRMRDIKRISLVPDSIRQSQRQKN
ncbi:hypothetical protein [Streptococcus oriscaviae]|uniref:Uncharacterized protein n=1 Tax=Streptococcus oriscaviae TaxID=2781599 RepID=A0ABX7YNC5_9STRE|nr:hypothetical protein [Streptococcus oriscaviae]QUE54932.1 hypothetical protein INT76_03350 [Streptococcus oriscaviae]